MKMLCTHEMGLMHFSGFGAGFTQHTSHLHAASRVRTSSCLRGMTPLGCGGVCHSLAETE